MKAEQSAGLRPSDDFQYQRELYRASNLSGVYPVRMDEQFKEHDISVIYMLPSDRERHVDFTR
ncbi:MAG: hypothetical protein EOM52_10205 [Clostridia bacterium]|nr:hypothetical protein [Clostridia bacterium]